MGQNERKVGSIFQVTKIIRYKDSIGWIINAFLVSLFLIFSIGRLTIIGQFFDDVFFDFFFGWYKYIFYILLITWLVFYTLGRRVKVNKKFLLLTILLTISLLWFTSSIVAIAESTNNTEVKAWDGKNFIYINGTYVDSWKANSVFGTSTEGTKKIFGFNGLFWKPYAGGGIVGTLLTSIFSYLTVYGSTVISFVSFLIIITNLISLFSTTENDPDKKTLRLFNIFHFNNASNEHQMNYVNDFNSNQVLHDTSQGDITIQYAGIDMEAINNPMSEEFLEQPDQEAQEDLGKTQIIQFGDNETPEFTTDFQKYSHTKQFNPKKAVAPKSIKKPKKWAKKSNQWEENKIILPDDYKQKLRELPVYHNAYGDEVPIERARDYFSEQISVTPFGVAGKNDPWTVNNQKRAIANQQNFNNHQQSPIKKPINSFNNSSQQAQTNNFDKVNAFEDNYTEEDIIYGAQNNNFQVGNFEQTMEFAQPVKNINQRVEQNDYFNPGFHSKPKTKNSLYRLPSVTILDEPRIDRRSFEINQEEAIRKGKNLNTVFQDFGIAAEVKNVIIGPSITKFEVTLSPGVNVRKITNIENNIRITLKTKNVRIEAPIPGKSAVGIESANAISDKVFFSQLIQTKSKIKSKLLLAIGKEVDGTPLLADLKTMPHLLIAGSTGSGKSVCINAMISSLLMWSKPSEIKLLLIDPKKVELDSYNGIPHLLAPVVTETSHANNALKKMVILMDERYELLKSRGARNIETYNKNAKKSEKLPYIVIVIDELADLMMTGKAEVEESIRRITQLARAAGIHLIVATQRPSTDVVTGVIKTNIPARISFSVASFVDSKTILDGSGAEKLIGKGDMLYSPADSNNFIRAQGAFINDHEIQELINYTKNQQAPDYFEEFLDLNDSVDDESGSSFGVDEFNDPLLEKIKLYIIETQKASTSFLQRKFGIGYNRAARIIDYLESDGVIGPARGTKPREVYISSYEQYN